MTRRPNSRSRLHHTLPLILPAALATLFPLAPAARANYSWTNPAGGSWSDLANWSPASVPGLGDPADFNLGAAAPDFPSYPGYTITLPPIGPGSHISVLTDKVTLTQPAANKSQFNSLGVTRIATDSASLTLTGGTFAPSAVTLIATEGTGSLSVSPNTVLDTGSYGIGASGFGGTATLAATGPNTFIQTRGLGLAEGAGTATLNLTNGAVALCYPTFSTTYPTTPINYNSYYVSGGLAVGTNSGTAHVNVTGPGSALAFAECHVGDGGTGTISLSNGAQAFLNKFSVIGSSDGKVAGSGTLTLDGTGTSLTFAGSTLDSLHVGSGALPPGPDGSPRPATGTISLSNSASLSMPNIPLELGYGGGAGSLSLASNSSLAAQSLFVSIGANSHGSVTISSGASLTTNQTSVGGPTPTGPHAPVGSVTVNPGGQLLTNSLTLRPSGTLTLHAGTVSVSQTLNLSGGTLSGSGTLHATLVDASTFAPIISPDGTLALDADLSLSQSAATLSFDLTSPSTYDRLTSLHTLSFGGTLALSLSDPSFTPSLGDSFDLLDFATRDASSTFSSLSLPPLPPGLTWDTSALYTTGTLVVLPEPTSLLTASALTLLLPLSRRLRT